MITTRTLLVIIGCLACEFLTGCTSIHHAHPFLRANSQPTHVSSAEAIIAIDCASLRVINDSLPLRADSCVEHRLSPSPAHVFADWLSQTIIATGTDGHVTIRIQEASLRREATAGKLRAMKYWPYQARVRLHVAQFNRHAKTTNSFSLHASRVRTIHEGFLSRPNHRDVWRMFTDIQKELSKELRLKLRRNAPVARPPSTPHSADHQGASPVVTRTKL